MLTFDMFFIIFNFQVRFCRQWNRGTTLHHFVSGALLTHLLVVETQPAAWDSGVLVRFKGFSPGSVLNRNLKHFTVGFVGFQATLMIFWRKGAAKLIVTSPLRCTPKNQHIRGELSLMFTSPFIEIKGYVKPCSAEELRRIQGIPLAELFCFVKLLQLVAPRTIMGQRGPIMAFGGS